MSPAQTKTTEWTGEKSVDKQQSKKTPELNAAEQTDGR